MRNLIERLSGLPQPFTAAQVARKGWAGIRTREGARANLDALASAGFVRRLPPNREGQITYAMPTASLDESEGRVHWSSWDNGEISTHDMTDDEGNAMFGIVTMPNDDADIEIDRLTKALESGKPARLRQVADAVCKEVGGPIPFAAVAWAMAIAQDRLDPEFAPLPTGRKLGGVGGSAEQTNDPVSTHMRGIARHLGIRYQVLLRAVGKAELELRAATREPTMKLAMVRKQLAA